MTERLSGGCLCGAVRYALAEPAKFSIQCFCRDCQKISGGGHLPQMAVERAALTASGPVKTFSWKSDGGNDLRFDFCSECGSPLFKTTTQAPDLVFVLAGSLDDPAAFVPGRKVFETSRQPWDAG